MSSCRIIKLVFFALHSSFSTFHDRYMPWAVAWARNSVLNKLPLLLLLINNLWFIIWIMYYYYRYIHYCHHFWWWWIFVAARRLSLAVVSRGSSLLGCRASAVAKPRLSSSGTWASLPRGAWHPPQPQLNPCPLCQQADSQPLDHQGSPQASVLRYKFDPMITL